MKANLGLVFVTLLTFAACGKKEGTAPATATNQGAAGNPLTAPVDYLGAVGKAKKVAEKTVDTVSLNRAIQLFHEQEDRFPKDMMELVTKRYLPSLPADPYPYGMNFVYDPAKGEVKIVKQP